MNRTFTISIARSLTGIAAAILMISSAPAIAQEHNEFKPAAIIWVNSLYGPNNSGIGLCARYAVLGIGTTVFAFPGDTAASKELSVRPGAIGFTVDLYLAFDLCSWLAIYGNAGFVGRIATYKTDSEILRNYQKHKTMSIGGGFQVSLASHLMLGVGYNGFIDAEDTGPMYNSIQSVVGQVGYRF
jgi:opacity protein-like surface antigen